MNKTIMYSILTILVAFSVLYNVHAEIYSSNEVRVNNETQTVTYFGSYQIQDTSNSNIGTSKYVPIAIYSEVEPLPYNISQYYPQFSNALVDWCNLTAYLYKNNYNSLGAIINTSVEVYNLTFSGSLPNVSTDYHQFQLLSRDSLNVFMTCHYTNAETLYQDGVLIGRFTSFFPAFQCKGCEDKSFEELSRQNDNVGQSIDNEVKVYRAVFGVAKFNMTLWLIASWLFKIALVLVTIALIIRILMFFYNILKEITQNV